MVANIKMREQEKMNHLKNITPYETCIVREAHLSW